MKKYFKLSVFILILCGLMMPVQAHAERVRASRSPQALVVDGQMTELRGYNIGGYNYYRLRDLAQILKGKVDFDLKGDHKEILVDRTKTYQSFPGDQSGAAKERAVLQPMRLKVLGESPADVIENAYNIRGFNYFRLRSVGAILGFDVSYDEGKNLAVITDRKSVV